MAITIDSQPSTDYFHSNRNNSLTYEVSSDDGDIVNIIADINIGGTYKLTVTHPVNTSGETTFRLGMILTDIITAQLRDNNFNRSVLTDTLAFKDMSAFWASLVVDFFEETENASGVLESNWAEGGAGTPDATSNNVSVTTMICDLNETTAIGEEYQMNQDETVDGEEALTNPKLFLTNRPRPSSVALTERDVLYCFVYNFGATSQAGQVSVKKYDSADSQLGSTINITIPDASAGVFAIECGPVNINNHTAGYIDSDVSYYTVEVQLYNRNLTTPAVSRVSEIFRFDVTSEPCGNTHQMLFWNDRGGFDSYTFRDEITRTGRNSKTAIEVFHNDLDSELPDAEIQRVDALQTYSLLNLNVTTDEMDWLRELLETAKAFAWINDVIYSTVILEQEDYLLESIEGFLDEFGIDHRIVQRQSQRQ